MINDKELYIQFIKDRIRESFFVHEKASLAKGLKFLGYSLEKYLSIQIETFEKDQISDSGGTELPEIDILALPQNPIAKRVESKLHKANKHQQDIMLEFTAVQLALSFITFEYFRTKVDKFVALVYGKFMIKNLDKLESRIGSRPPQFIRDYRINMKREIELLENDQRMAQELIPIESKSLPMTTVHQIHFEDFGASEFERLTFAFVNHQKKWKSIEWSGQTGLDGGRDIWGSYEGKNYCYQCANYKNLTFKKVKEDIDKLVNNKTIPDIIIIVCGGRITNGLRRKITNYSTSVGIASTTMWSGVEFEEKLRVETPAILKRFVKGDIFPELAKDYN